MKAKEFLESIKAEDVLQELLSITKTNITDIIGNSHSKNAILAGGSVANYLFFKYLGQHQPEIKDLDIFYTWREIKSVQDIEDEYGGAFFFIGNTLAPVYKLLDVKKFDKFNIIMIDIDGEKKATQELGYSVIEGFDLNCCQASISLVDKKLHWTPAFEEFLETKDLKVLNPFNFGGTAMRLLDKKNYLGGRVTLNLKREMEILYQSWIHFKDQFNMKYILRRDNARIGYLFALTDYFDIDRKEDEEKLLDEIFGDPTYEISDYVKVYFKKNLFPKKQMKDIETFNDVRKLYEIV